jgi:predicted ribosome quality control (RQC) complex YloA/Tae2 family protein
LPEVEIDLTKSLQENAARYFEKAKKARKKLKGAEKAVQDLEKKVKVAALKEKGLRGKAPEKKRKKAWYEQFHWFESSDGFLVIGGRDAQSNEVVVKKYMDENDVYFHADIHGAPHCVIKIENGKPPEKTLKEAAVFAAVYSKAWKEKIASVDVYSVKPEQVSKKSPSGESLGKGAFMIYGQRQWFKKTPLRFAVGVQEKEGRFLTVSGPLDAVKKQAKAWREILPGEKKKGEIAKVLKHYFEAKLPQAKIELDELLRLLPSGGSEIKMK